MIIGMVAIFDFCFLKRQLALELHYSQTINGYAKIVWQVFLKCLCYMGILENAKSVQYMALPKNCIINSHQ